MPYLSNLSNSSAGQVADLEADVALLQAQQATTDTALAGQAASISANAANAAANAATIAQNSNDLTGLASDVAQNALNVAQNATAIAALQNGASAAAILALQIALGIVQADVAALQSLAADNASDIVGLANQVAANDALIAANEAGILALQAQTAANAAALADVTPQVLQRFTAGQTNINAATGGTGTDVEWGAASVLTDASVFAVTNSQESRILVPGLYSFGANVAFTSSVGRANVAMRFQFGFNTGEGPVGQGGYVRGSSGHNESSAHIAPWLRQVTAAEVPLTVELAGFRMAAGGTVNVTAGQGSMTIMRLRN